MEAKIDREPVQLKHQLSGSFPSKLDIIEQETKKIWKKGEFYHVYYTLHGMDHSNSVIEILGRLVDGLNPEDKLNETEILALRYFMWVDVVKWLPNTSKSEEKG